MVKYLKQVFGTPYVWYIVKLRAQSRAVAKPNFSKKGAYRCAGGANQYAGLSGMHPQRHPSEKRFPVGVVCRETPGGRPGAKTPESVRYAPNFIIYIIMKHLTIFKWSWMRTINDHKNTVSDSVFKISSKRGGGYGTMVVFPKKVRRHDSWCPQWVQIL